MSAESETQNQIGVDFKSIQKKKETKICDERTENAERANIAVDPIASSSTVDLLKVEFYNCFPCPSVRPYYFFVHLVRLLRRTRIKKKPIGIFVISTKPSKTMWIINNRFSFVICRFFWCLQNIHNYGRNFQRACEPVSIHVYTAYDPTPKHTAINWAIERVKHCDINIRLKNRSNTRKVPKNEKWKKKMNKVANK